MRLNRFVPTCYSTMRRSSWYILTLSCPKGAAKYDTAKNKQTNDNPANKGECEWTQIE